MLTLFLCFLLEIQTVVYRYNPQLCNQLCSNLLEQELEKFPLISGFSIFRSDGRVVLYWRPYEKFSYPKLKFILQKIGLGFFNPFEVRVRGTIFSKGREIYINSIGDDSQFRLLGEAPKSTTQYVTRGNISMHPLREPLISRLLQAEEDERVVEIHGELYMPEAPFAPPDKLIVTRLTIPQL